MVLLLHARIADSLGEEYILAISRLCLVKKSLIVTSPMSKLYKS